MDDKLTVLGDRVLIRPLAKSETTESGILISSSSKERPVEGEVISVGKGKFGNDGTLTSMSVKVGDKVLYTKYGGSEIKLNDIPYLVMKEPDILGIITEEEDSSTVKERLENIAKDL